MEAKFIKDIYQDWRLHLEDHKTINITDQQLLITPGFDSMLDNLATNNSTIILKLDIRNPLENDFLLTRIGLLDCGGAMYTVNALNANKISTKVVWILGTFIILFDGYPEQVGLTVKEVY
jgi:hypothetical protein